MKSIAVLHLLNNFGDASITRIVEKIVENSRSQNINWHIGALSPIGDMQSVFNELNCNTVDFSSDTGRKEKTTLRIREYLTNHKIDIIHTHTPRTILQVTLALGKKLPTVHLATKHILNSPGDRRWGWMYAVLDRLALYLPDEIVAVSHTLYKQILANPGLRTEHVSVIQNAIDCEYFYAPEQRENCRLEYGLKPTDFLIGSVGRLDKVKRYDLLLQGFSEIVRDHPNARLMIIGDGSLKEMLVSLATKLGVADSLILPGFRKDIPRLLAAMDVYVQTSVNEGLSLSILEAMASKKAVIITDVGGAREIVMQTKTGIIIQPYSIRAIAGAISELIIKPKMRLAIASSAREYVTREFNFQRMTTSYCTIYKKIVRNI
ncbi:MAG: glycosyltransferase family 4 protein [Geobacteraceae bacterium]|nr:glycosyltransferase family 4 protein [Geobacteraceae bacterium]